ncbi:MAG: response regulator [Rhizobiaceae bacterium]|nr:response regulator [Rhizobiaceae bacterium]
MTAIQMVHVVDDDPGVLKGIQRLLSAHGFAVRAFASSKDFEEQADPYEADCLILDVHMGPTTGIELMERLILSGCKAPVVIITASDSDHVRKAASKVGCSAFLQKPIPANVLIDTLRSLVGSGFKGSKYGRS